MEEEAKVRSSTWQKQQKRRLKVALDEKRRKQKQASLFTFPSSEQKRRRKLVFWQQKGHFLSNRDTHANWSKKNMIENGLFLGQWNYRAWISLTSSCAKTYYRFGGPFGKRKVLWHGNYFWPFFKVDMQRGACEGSGKCNVHVDITIYDNYKQWRLIFSSQSVYFILSKTAGNGGRLPKNHRLTDSRDH